MMTNRVVRALLMRRGTTMRIPFSSSSNSRRSSNYISPLQTFQSLSGIEILTTGNKTLFSNGNTNSTYTNFSSSLSRNKRSFGSDSDSDSDSGLSSQKNNQPLKMLRNDLEMWSRRTTRDAPDRATTILQQIFTQYNEEVNVRDCNQVISAWNKTRNRNDSPQKALEVLELMIDVYDEHGNDSVRPTVATYNLVIDTFAHKGDIENSCMVFNMQNDDFETRQNVKAKPDLRTFGNMIYACSKSKSNNAAEIAKGILATIIDWHEKGKLKEGPNARILITVMNACARNGDVDGATLALQMMENDVYEVPYVRVYSIIINAWSKSGKVDSPAQARCILQKLIKMHSSGYLNEGPDTITYTSVIDTYAAQGDVEGACDILKMMEDDFNSGNNNAKPNLMTYNTLINAWFKSSHADAPCQAMNLLNKIIDLYSKGDLEEGPNTATYNTVINAYAARGDAEGACSILGMMEKDFDLGNGDAKPTTRTYNTLIHAWCRSGKDNASHKAMDLLEKVIRMYSKGNLEEEPDTITYSAVMDAYAEQGDIQGASDVNEMMKNAFKSGNKNARPNAQTYSIIIKAWGKSSKNNAPEEVEKILQEINDLHKSGDLKEGPHKKTYSSMIHCLKKFKGTEKRVRELMNLKKSCKYEN